MYQVVRGVTDLATTHPQLAAEWDYEKNGTLSPFCFTAHSSVKVWWKCKGTDPKTGVVQTYSWCARISNRAMNGSGCPQINLRLGGMQKKVVALGVNDLATTHPKIVAEWDYEKNGELKPTDVYAESALQVWWKIETISPVTNQLVTLCWKSRICERAIRGYGCPYLSNLKVLTGFNDLAALYPEIAAEWDYEKNGDLKPTDVFAKSRKKVWWKIETTSPVSGQPVTLSWNAKIRDRTVLKRGYPYLSNFEV